MVAFFSTFDVVNGQILEQGKVEVSKQHQYMSVSGYRVLLVMGDIP